jgi:glucose-1-phosphate adenylyltransferase
MKDVLTVIMAGGKGTRLKPLTEDRSKPAVPFGGIYRLIDIRLSNCINSQLYKILIFPQHKSQSLVDHLEEGWNIFSGDLGHYLRIVAPQHGTGESSGDTDLSQDRSEGWDWKNSGEGGLPQLT